MDVQAIGITAKADDVSTINDTQQQRHNEQQAELASKEVVAKVVALQGTLQTSIMELSSPSNQNFDDVAEAALVEAVNYVQNHTGDDGDTRDVVDGSNEGVGSTAIPSLVQNPFDKSVPDALIPVNVVKNPMHSECQNPIPINQSVAASFSVSSSIQNPINIQETANQTITSALAAEETSKATKMKTGITLHTSPHTNCQPQTASITSQLERQMQSIPATWEAQFQKLLAYKLKHGHCKVPKKYSSDPQLGRWVNTVSCYTRTDISHQKICLMHTSAQSNKCSHHSNLNRKVTI